MTHNPLLGPVSDVNTYQMLIGGDFVDDSTCMSVARRVRAGTVWINTFMDDFPELPFGGYRQSGLGRELGRHAVEDYTETKTLTSAHRAANRLVASARVKNSGIGMVRPGRVEKWET